MTGKRGLPAATGPERTDSEPIQGQIEADLRQQILHGVIPPGGRINVRQLEGVYKVSHIPIREAIRRLEGEGLVVTVPNRGAVAAEVSLRELDEVYDLRRIVEPQVIRRAAAKATPEERDAVTGRQHQLELAESGGTPEEFSQAHWDFHWSLLAPGASQEIERLVHRLWRVADRYLRLSRTSSATVVDVAHEQHDHLYKAFLDGDADEVAHILERHLYLTGDALREGFHQTMLG